MSYRDAQTWAEDNGNIPYYETSAKEGTHIKETFELIARNAVKAQASMYLIYIYICMYIYVYINILYIHMLIVAHENHSD